MDELGIVIRSLNPERCEDWLQYFDRIAFQDHEEWAFCYCLEGHLTPKMQEEWTDAKERRERAIDLIRSGEMQGYLAYSEDTVVGWCNANDRASYRYLTEMFRSIGYQPEGPTDAKIKAIYCFLVAPEYRGRGVAQRLLDRACEDAAREGYFAVEVYPFADEKFPFQYHGTEQMYKNSGFVEIADLKYVKVMRRNL